MTDAEILTRLTRTLRDILGNDDLVLRPETVRADVEGWDSFAYISFIATLEMDLGIKFGVAEVESFQNVGDIVAAVRGLLA